MELEQAKEVVNKMYAARRQKMYEIEVLDKNIIHAEERLMNMCPHEHVAGKLIKWCQDCGHAEMFWSFPKRGGTNRAR
ncbi:hypothetical protein [Bacillus phage BC-T25]|nr:hypothetical protein [Bacillus phage BC-T25]